jgi:hypothetical protein
MRKYLFALVITLAFAGMALSGTFEDANDAYQRGDYATATAIAMLSLCTSSPTTSLIPLSMAGLLVGC